MPQLAEQATPQQVMDANKAEEAAAAAAAKPEAGDEGAEDESEENPLAEKGEKGEGDSEGAEGDDDSGEEKLDAKPKVPWYKREIAKLKGKLNLSTAENQSLKSALAQQKRVDDAAAAVEEETEELDADGKPKPKPAKAAKPAATGLSEEDVERRATEKANATVAQNEFNKQCNTAFDNGVGEFKDWDEAVENLKEVGALDNIPFLQAVLESEFPHRVLHELAQDQDEAARINSLPPIKMAVAIAKLKGTQPKEKKTSKAPDPLKPIKPGNKGEKSLEDMSAEEFASARDKEIADKRKARNASV